MKTGLILFLLLIFISPKVQSLPNGGLDNLPWIKGELIKIELSEYANVTRRAELWVSYNSTFLTICENCQPNNGSIYYAVPTNLKEGLYYKVWLLDKNGNTIFLSDNLFPIFEKNEEIIPDDQSSSSISFFELKQMLQQFSEIIDGKVYDITGEQLFQSTQPFDIISYVESQKFRVLIIYIRTINSEEVYKVLV